MTWNKIYDKTADIVCMSFSAIVSIKKEVMEKGNMFDPNKVKIAIIYNINIHLFIRLILPDTLNISN